MELKQLQYFIAVASAGGFTRASLKLGVMQPVLSKQIRRLETEIRQSLFRRHGRGVALTDAGKLLLARAGGILDDVEQTRRELDAMHAKLAGSVVIAMPIAIQEGLPTDFVRAFQSNYPKSSLEIINGKSTVIQQWVLQRRIDIGLIHGSASDEGLDCHPLAKQDLCLISQKDTPLIRPGAAVPFRDFRRLPLIVPAGPHPMRTLLDTQAARLGVRLNVALQAEGNEFVTKLVRQGYGHAVLPDLPQIMLKFCHGVQKNDIVSPRLKRKLNVVTSQENPPSRIARGTIQLLKRYIN